jgi:hypothetical protein
MNTPNRCSLRCALPGQGLTAVATNAGVPG